MDLVTLALAKKYTDDTVSGSSSLQGKDGKSAYQIALDNGFIGTEADWLESLKGEDGEQGQKGDKGEIGPQGEKGKSAYQIALDEGFIGTEEEWLETLKGENGSSGVYVGEEEPSDINIKVWIKPDGNVNVIDGSVVGL